MYPLRVHYALFFGYTTYCIHVVESIYPSIFLMFAICVVHLLNKIAIILQLKNFKFFLFQGLLLVVEGFSIKELKVSIFFNDLELQRKHDN
jgi:hypothetical protein